MATTLSNLDIARKILEAAGGELSVKEIVEQAAAAGLLLGTSSEVFLPRVMASLSNSVKRKESPFARVKNARGGFKSGVYRLKRARTAQLELPTPEPSEVSDTGFVGRGGEYAVMSELLFRGFNVSLMTVDKGVDVVAANDQGKYFHIQVKTARARDGVFQFTIKRQSFEANNASSTFYVFVLRRETRSDFMILPSNQLATYMALGVLRGQDAVTLRVVADAKTRKFMLNGSQDVTIFANRFGQIC